MLCYVYGHHEEVVMSTKYEAMVGDYCLVSNAIDQYVLSEVKDFDYWDTDLTEFFIDTETTTNAYNYAEASTILNVTASQMQHFLVVHDCLGNHLDELIGEKEYELWDVKGKQLVITFSDDSEQAFQISDICALMCKTETLDWSYAALVDAEKEGLDA